MDEEKFFKELELNLQSFTYPEPANEVIEREIKAQMAVTIQDYWEKYRATWMEGKKLGGRELTEEDVEKLKETWEETLKQPLGFLALYLANKNANEFLRHAKGMKTMMDGLKEILEPPINLHHALQKLSDQGYRTVKTDNFTKDLQDYMDEVKGINQKVYIMEDTRCQTRESPVRIFRATEDGDIAIPRCPMLVCLKKAHKGPN